MINQENCKGCRSYIYSYGKDVIETRGCSGFISLDEGECPCINCIVKVMCEEFCNDYIVAVNQGHERVRVKNNESIDGWKIK